MKDKLTKISGGFVIGLSILVTFLSLMKGVSSQITTPLSFCLIFVATIFISSANRKEGGGQIFCWITLVSSLFMIVFTLLKMIAFKESSTVIYGTTSTPILVFGIGMIVTLLATFLSIITNTLSNDGTVEGLRKLVVILTCIFIGYFVLCLVMPSLVSVPIVYLVSIGQTVLLIATLFVLVLDKIHTFEEISNLTSNYRVQADVIQKLKEVEEQTNKEKEELLQKIAKLEKKCLDIPKQSYPQQTSVNTYSQLQTVPLKSEPVSSGSYFPSSDAVVVDIPSSGTDDILDSLESSVSPNPTLVEQTPVVSVPNTSSPATNPIPQLKL